MTGPWEPEDVEPSRSEVSRGRRVIWILLLLGLFGGLFLLYRAFPGAIRSGDDWAWLGWGVGLMFLVSSAILAPGRIRWGEKVRHAAIWAGIVAVLVLAVTYRAELAGVGQRVRMQFSSSYPVAVSARELVVTQGDEGAFFVMGAVNGQRVRFLVDTGASDTVLSPADARRLGIDVDNLHFDRTAETANGNGYGAGVIADRVAVGDIAFSDMPLVVNQAPMSNSLLGMTFLRRLESFQVKGDKLYLKARD